MNRIAFIALALVPALLCSCGSPKDKKKKKDLMTQTLGQRLNKPDMDRVSPYQKYMSDPSKGRNISSKWQQQTHKSSNFKGAEQFKGLSKFETSEAKGITASRYGQSTFSGSDNASQFAGKNFDAAMNRNATKMSRDGKSVFSAADKIFGTDHALPANQREGKLPEIIENRPGGAMPGKTYSEDDVKRLLGRP